MHAARQDVRDSDAVQTALSRYLGFELLDRVQGRSDLTDEEAMELAVSEQHAMRGEKRAAGGR